MSSCSLLQKVKRRGKEIDAVVPRKPGLIEKLAAQSRITGRKGHLQALEDEIAAFRLQGRFDLPARSKPSMALGGTANEPPGQCPACQRSDCLVSERDR